ncbi:MAG: hypothetical protein H7Y05_12500 [Steroidobacteraceae bacterium]|nr:hypothetical protein [Deltaproteobacteria bacterium]
MVVYPGYEVVGLRRNVWGVPDWYLQMVTERKNDPQFVAAYEELKTETAELRKGLQSHKRSGLTQFFRQSPLHDVEINLDRSADYSRLNEQ